MSCPKLNENMFIKNISLKDANIVARFDFNISLTDHSRIHEALPTIKYILSQNPNRLILTTHYGRPKVGKSNEEYSVKFMVDILENLLGESVMFLNNPNDIKSTDKGIFLLENVRFHSEETECNINSEYADSYFYMGDIFVIDAFGCIHRDHLSISGITKINYANKKSCYGFLIDKELQGIKNIMSLSSGKALFIFGGAKKDKLKLIDQFSDNPNITLFVAGYLSNLYNKNKENIIKASDGITSDGKIVDFESGINTLDAGPKSIEILKREIDDSDVIFWNGPLGMIEDPLFINGTKIILEYLTKVKDKQIIIGGGETGTVANNMGIKSTDNLFISTGGGALMEYLQHTYELPGLKGFSKYA